MWEYVEYTSLRLNFNVVRTKIRIKLSCLAREKELSSLEHNFTIYSVWHEVQMGQLFGGGWGRLDSFQGENSFL